VRRGARLIRACYQFDRRANLGWDKSLRTIFTNKNISGYCRYIGLNTLFDFRTVTACIGEFLPQCGKRRDGRSGPHRLPVACRINTHQTFVAAPPQRSRDLMTKA
jgi:hypothetical protein